MNSGTTMPAPQIATISPPRMTCPFAAAKVSTAPKIGPAHNPAISLVAPSKNVFDHLAAVAIGCGPPSPDPPFEPFPDPPFFASSMASTKTFVGCAPT
jgi:hypothetical protein